MRLLVPVLTRVFSALLALALIAVGVVALVEICAAWLGAGWAILPDDTATQLEGWQWNDRPVVGALAVLGAIGVAALLIGSWRRAPLTVPLDGQAEVRFERHALEQSLQRRIETLDGVARAKVRVDARDVVVRVDTNRRHQPEELKARIEDRLAEIAAMQHVDLRRHLRLRYRGGEL